VLGAAGGLAVLVIGLWVVLGLGGRGPGPQAQRTGDLPQLHQREAQRVQEALSVASKVVILGNSVAETGSVANLAISGGQPAHWLAILKHQVLGQGLAPKAVVIYAPMEMLNQTTLVAASDRRLLLDLLPEGDLALTRKALGKVGIFDKVLLARSRMRDETLTRLSHLPLELIYGPGSASHVTVGEGAPRDPRGDRWGLVEDEVDQETQSPKTTRLTESFFPDLVELARDGAVRLVFVAPATRPGQRGACGVLDETLEALQEVLPTNGVDLIDLRWAPVDGRRFTRRHHLDHIGRLAASKALGAALAELKVATTGTADASTRTWFEPCSGGG
jgi:hypothetical protein